MLKIDASYGEGGGQIIRTALALSTITNIPFEAYNIRQGRPEPGLKAQHLMCIKALEQLADAKTEFAELGSEKLIYTPGNIKGKSLTLDIGTAGSVSLLLQSLILPCLFAEKRSKLKITGGTDGRWAMPYDFLKNVFLPHINQFAQKLDINMQKRGYFPRGGGEIELKIIPLENKQFPSIISESQYSLIQIKGISHASKFLQQQEVADRQAKSAKLILNKLNVPINIQTEYAETFSPGSGIVLWAIFSKDKTEIDIKNPIILGADALGEKNKRSEVVGQEAAENLLKEMQSTAPIDSHTADSLIPFMALNPESKIKVSEITEHTKTNIWITEQFLKVKFQIEGSTITCTKT